ncbi:MAG: HEAT repeat domain-containing protein [Phycisphaerales bacterium]|nr:MAG: HEAT repeat domain-containing protein [Phycisphaerales bacterium]
MTLGIAAMAAVWVIVILSRHAIWAHWWAYKLQRTDDVAERLEYLARLAGLGEASVPVAADLIRSNDVEFRSFGVFLLSKADSPVAAAHLRSAINDEDEDIRRTALQAYAAGGGPNVMRELVRLMNGDRSDVALTATAQLAVTRRAEAIPILIDAVRMHANVAVRVQAIQSLAMADATEAVDALIDCLDDTTTYVGQTATEEAAARALNAVANAGSLPDHITHTDGVMEPAHVVGGEAAKALRIITGQSFGYRHDDETARASAIAAWRQWRESQAEP